METVADILAEMRKPLQVADGNPYVTMFRHTLINFCNRIEAAVSRIKPCNP